jgi:heme exporter protein A
MLIATDLACSRGGRLIFSNLSFTLKSGDFIDLRGPNGAGKSSLLRLLAGFDQPASGSLVVSAPVIHIGHADAIKTALTVKENLDFWASCFGSSETTKALAAFSLNALADDPAALLSQGQKRRLALARLIIANRPIWLLDEPTVGLDAASLENLRDLIHRHLANSGAVIAATHADLGIDPTATLELKARG